VYVGDAAHPYNVFDFTFTRSRDGPQQFLKDSTEVLLADAYGGYSGVVAGNALTRAGCWSHARRRFIEAEPSAPEIAREVVAVLRELFAVEQQAKELSAAERLARRSQHRGWPNYGGSCCAGRSNCYPSILWPRRSITRSASGRN
jgi:transposase